MAIQDAFRVTVKNIENNSYGRYDVIYPLLSRG